MVDSVDAQILHALQVSPRASFRLVGEVAGVSEQTVARRYRALRRLGVVRVVGLVNPAVRGSATWVARITCRPDRVDAVAEALVRRPDVSFAHLASGGAEIVCTLNAPLSEGQGPDVLPRRLKRSAGVLGLDMSLLVHSYSGPWAHWTGYGPPLGADALDLLLSHLPRHRTQPGTVPGVPAPPVEEDAPLLAALAEDGRAGHARLAQLAGWTPGRVARRLETLEETGTLFYDVDLLAERLGWELQATLWLRTAPARLHEAGTALARHPEVAFAGAIAGEYNLMAIVICADARDYYRYLTGDFAAVPGIDTYTASIRSRHLKQAASVITQGRLVPPHR